MADRLRHVLRALSAPWAITPEAFETVCEIIDRRAAGVRLSSDEIAEIVRESNAEFAERHAAASALQAPGGGAVAVISIYGTILPRPVSDLSGGGGCALTSFMEKFKAAEADPSVGQILLDVDSPGGSASLVPEAAAMIRDCSKPVTAIANTTCASAAYWLASQADEFVASPSAMVGSIGVYSRHVDYSGALAQDGIKVTYISAGDNKVEGNPTEPLSDSAAAYLQAMVDECYDNFVSSVALGRSVDPQEVLNSYGQGRMFSAVAAAGLGMVDRVATFDQVVAQMLGTSTSGYGQRYALALDDSTIDALDTEDSPAASAERHDDTETVVTFAPHAEALLARREFREANSNGR
jgi:signal peptide peptidase SppA